MAFQPKVSVIINTDARAESLKATLDSLRWLEYPAFEVCAVYGPTGDGTKELLEARTAEIKIAHCSTRNLSRSRNIGIAMAAGEIVAFLDDDSIPEPEWLSKVVAAFEQDDVGACGGFLHDNTGIRYQWRFGTVDRLGVADESWDRPPNEFNFPFTANFTHVMANSAFRKSAVLAIGGFDEQYEYYLDETDLICRLVDHAWRIVSIGGAAVHHKFLPSHIRDKGVFKSWSQLVKSKIYFSLVNSHGHHGLPEAVKSTFMFIEALRTNLEWGMSQGRANDDDRSRFESEVGRGLQGGLEAGLARARRLPDRTQLDRFAGPFVPFPILSPPSERQTLCLLTKTYPPAAIGGIGRHVHQLSRAMACLGHQIHVLTRGAEQDTVDFEDGVWVHRICPKQQSSRTVQGVSVPQHIWDYSASMLAEVQRIEQSRKVDAVIAPIWDCEGIAFLVDGHFKLVTGLYTTFQQWLQTTGNRQHDAAFMEGFIQPMLALEKLLFKQSDGILADSQAIIRDIEGAYDLRFDIAKLGLVLLGLEDWSSQPVIKPPALPPGAVRVLFVGRLEARKGIDVLLGAATAVLAAHPQVHLDIVGDDTLVGPGHLTYRAIFDGDPGANLVRDRVHFHGEVSESALRGFYQACDVFVAPSRFESFGLILLEAMMFGKPVIGCRAGGMSEIVEHGISGFLAEPGDVGSLANCLQQLLAIPQLRARLGEAGRHRYMARFTAEVMARDTLEFIFRLPERAISTTARPIAAPISWDCSRLKPAVPMAPRSRPRRRIVLINSVLARHDAVSGAVRDMYHMLATDRDLEVLLFAGHNDFSDLPCRLVSDSAQLLLEPDYLNADLIIWHFGIFYEFFNALLMGNGRARQVVVFHNVTPREYVSDAAAPLIDRSLQQCHNLRYVDEVWNDSDENASVARRLGVQDQRIRVIPLCVETPTLGALKEKRDTTVEALFVGRFVKSKGVVDLIEAVARLPRRELGPFRLNLAGNLDFSDPLYVSELRSKIESYDLLGCVSLLGTVDEPTLVQLYQRAHMLVIPSYHEGFCKPVIEGLRAGCIPVGYANSNLSEIAAGLGRMVPSGDIDALTGALAELLREIPEALAHPAQQRLTLDRGQLSIAQFDAASRDYVACFTPERISSQLCERVGALLRVEEKIPNLPPSDRHAMAL